MFFKNNILLIILNIELWERFAFYGLQTIMNTYLIKNKLLLLTESDVISIFSSFTAILYILIPLGEWLSNEVLGRKRTTILGLIISIIGYSLIAISKNNKEAILLGMSILAVGYYIFKINPSLILTEYCKNKPNNEIDSIFTKYYLVINIGSLCSMLITPYLLFKFGWEISVLISILSLMISLLISLIYNNLIMKYGTKTDYKKISKKNIYLTIFIIVISTLSFNLILNIKQIYNILLLETIFIFIYNFFKKILQLNYYEKKRMIAIFILMMESLFFFILYGQIPISINLFTIKHIQTNIWGYKIKAEQFQSLNPFWILLLSPILDYIYKKKKNISIAYKFLIGIIIYSISFIILLIGININLIHNKYLISPIWMIICYLLQSLGELLISGLGLSMIIQLSPAKLTNLSINSWFLNTSVSFLISGKLANLITNETSSDKIKSLIIFKYFFIKIIILCTIVTILISIITPSINKIITKKKIKNKKNKKLKR